MGICIASYIPSVSWVPQYRSRFLLADIVAGLTVGFMVIPQALAYAAVAELPIQYGLYAAFPGVIIYCIFGTSKDVSVGPTAIMSILTATACEGDVTKAIALCLACGMVQVLVGACRGGFLVDYISHPVTCAYISAASITIAASQVHSVVGYSLRKPFLQLVYDIFALMNQLKGWNFAMGLLCIAALQLGAHLKRRNGKKSRLLFFILTSQNVIVVSLCTIISYCIYDPTKDVKDQILLLTGTVPAGLPTPAVPKLPAQWVEIMQSSVSIALIGLLEHIAIGKSMATIHGYLSSFDANQEFIACGLANIAVACFQGYPICGSLSRTSVNSEAGVLTPLGGLFTGIIVVAALLCLTPAFYFVPSTALAAIIINALLPMTRFGVAAQLWRMRAHPGVYFELLCASVCFLGCLLVSIELGMELAIGLAVALALYRTARPAVNIALPGSYDRGALSPSKSVAINGLPRAVSVSSTTSSVQVNSTQKRVASAPPGLYGSGESSDPRGGGSFKAHKGRVSRDSDRPITRLPTAFETEITNFASDPEAEAAACRAAPRLDRKESLSGVAPDDLLQQGVLLVSMWGPLSHACAGHLRDTIIAEERKHFDDGPHTLSPLHAAVNSEGLGEALAQPLLTKSESGLRALILDLSSVPRLDFTAAETLEQLLLQYRARPESIAVFFVGMRREVRAYIQAFFAFNPLLAGFLESVVPTVEAALSLIKREGEVRAKFDNIERLVTIRDAGDLNN